MIRQYSQKADQRRIWWLVLCLPLIALSSCKKEDAQSPGKRPGNRPTAIQVQTTTVQRMSIQRQVDLSGTLMSPDQAKVSSEVAGVVRQVLVELGYEVKPGQVLVKLEPRELELALSREVSLVRQTEAQLGIDGVKIKEPPPDEEISIVRTAIANRDDARAQLARARRLRSQNLLAQADLDTAETRVKVTEAAYQSSLESLQSLKASLQERRGAVELAQKKLDDAVIRAPVAGAVSERLVYPGEFIRENTPVINLVQMNPLKLKTAVQEKYAGLIHPNQPVQFWVESFPDAVFKGRIAFISPAIDQTVRTFAVEVLVDNQDRRLKPGFFAKGVIFTRRDEDVLGASEDAVSTLAGVSAVFVIENNKVRQQIVGLGVHEGNLFEIVSGLKGSEILATSNLNLLATGVSVEVKQAGDAASPGKKPAKEASAGGERGGRL
jgi:RND family efflux transporter MFP subunit